VLSLDKDCRPATAEGTRVVQQQIAQACNKYFQELPLWAECKSQHEKMADLVGDVRAGWSNGKSLCTEFIKVRLAGYIKDQRLKPSQEGCTKNA